MKKVLTVMSLVICMVSFTLGCRSKEEEVKEKETIQIQVTEQDNETIANEDKPQVTSVKEEMDEIEAKYQEILNRDSSNYTQVDMNIESYEMYELWDEELNALWKQLENTLDSTSYAKLLEEQRAWIKRKELHVRAYGSEAFGGTMQPMLESSGAASVTRARCYELAKILADARGEQYSIDEMEDVISYEDPSYDDVMWGFRGPHDLTSYDDSTGELMISHEYDEWEAIITYNGERQDVEVWAYNSERIIWKSAEDKFFELGNSWEGELEFTCREDLREYTDSY